MSAVLSLWFSVVLLLVCGSSKGLKIIPAEAGGNVILTCKDENNHSLVVLEWSREDLGDEAVFLFRDGRPSPSDQHKSYRNRVFLKDSQMKDGDLSVVLKNVTMNDNGTYECRVKRRTKRSILEAPPISSIRLSVVPRGDPSPGDPSPGEQGGRKEDGGREEDGLSPGGIIGIVLPVVAVAAAVVVVVLWMYRKKKGPNQSSSGSNMQQNPEQDRLNSDSEV